MKYILLHGLGQTASSWNAVREALDVKSGVLCPELSEWLSGTSGSYRDLYREMERFCGQFDEPLALCGLSLGGMLALNYAAEHEAQVKALVLIGTQPSVPKTLLKIQNTVFRIMPAAAFGSMGFDKKNGFKPFPLHGKSGFPERSGPDFLPDSCCLRRKRQGQPAGGNRTQAADSCRTAVCYPKCRP